MSNTMRPALLVGAAIASILTAVLLGGSFAWAQPKLESTVVFAGVGGSSQEIFEKEILPGFTKKTGVKVVYVSGTVDKLFAQVHASAATPDIDVLWGNPTTHLAGKAQGLYDRIDYKVVTNAAQLFPRARDSDAIGVVMGFNLFGLHYHAKILSEKGIAPPSSWNDLWDSRYKGHVALYNIDTAFTQFVLPAFAKWLGTTTDRMDPVFARLSALKPSLVAIVSSPAEMSTLYQQGAVWLSVNSNARVFHMRDAGVPVDWVAPREGAVELPNYLEVTKKAPHPNAAQALVNYILGPDVQKVLAEKLYYAPVYKGLQLSEKLQRETYYSASGENALVSVDAADLTRQLPSWTRRWNAEVVR